MILTAYHFNSDIRDFLSHITYYFLMFFIAYAFKGQVHVFAGRVKIDCKSLVLQDKCNIEIFLSPDSVLPARLQSMA